MSEARRFLPDEIKGHLWGLGTLTETLPASVSLDARYKRARLLAHSAGCPIPQEIIDRKGVDAAAQDYAVVNKIFRQMYGFVSSRGLPELLTSRIRLPGEPVGHFEDYAVPEMHLKAIRPKAGIYGYASTRLIRDISTRLGLPPQVMVPSQHALEVACRASNLPTFLIRLGEEAIRLGVEPTKVLGYVFSKSILHEENTLDAYQYMAFRADSGFAPNLWDEYLRLDNANELDKYSIAKISPKAHEGIYRP